MLLRKGLVSVILLGVLLSACAPATLAVSKSQTQTLRIGVLPIVDALPLYVAEAEGYFKATGLDVQFVPVGSSAERDQLMQAGQLDGMINDLVSTVLYNAQTQKIAAVAMTKTATPDQPEYFVLAAKGSGISKPADLKGVTIGVSDGTVIQYVTYRLLEKAGLAPSDIKTTDVPKIPDRMQLLASGQLKAATLPDPLASLAISDGATIVVDNSGDPAVGSGVLSFSLGALSNKTDAVREFMAAYEKAMDDINHDPARWSSLLSEKQLVPEALVGKYQVPRFPVGKVPTEAQFMDVENWMTSQGLIKTQVPYAKLVNTSFLPK